MSSNKLLAWFNDPKRLEYAIILTLDRFFHYSLSDKLVIKAQFYQRMGYELDLDRPVTYNEKLNWLKLYDRNPLYSILVDKIKVKEYVANIIGNEYIVPTLGVWNSPEEINLDSLPDQFVLKCNHNSGIGLFICKNKNDITKEKWQTVLNNLKIGLKENFYNRYREWPYKNVPHKILAEKYLDPGPNNRDLPDYKFFCFNGEVKALFVATERNKLNEEVKFNFFDADFNPLPFRQRHELSKVIPQKPKNFETMKIAASKLSKGIRQVRVDFYEVNNTVYFGELTFFHFSGYVPFEPVEWDKRLGDMLSL